MTLVSETMSLARSEDTDSAAKTEDLRARAFTQLLIDAQCERFRLPSARVQLECEPQWMIRGVNAFALSSLLSNLISNAVKYTPDAHSPVKVRLVAAQLGGQPGTCIEVEDEGIGIPESFQDRLFTAFQRAENVLEIDGTGLGMVIVLSSLEALGATISFESVPKRPKGTLFRVFLPNALDRMRPSDVETALPI